MLWLPILISKRMQKNFFNYFLQKWQILLKKSIFISEGHLYAAHLENRITSIPVHPFAGERLSV